MTGNTIGAGEKEKARAQSKTFIVISLGLGIVASLMILGLRGFMVDFYNVADSTKEIAYSIMNLMCFVCIFQAMGNINMFGTLRGGGDSRFVLICDVGAMWGLSVPLGFLSGLVFHWPISVSYTHLDVYKRQVFAAMQELRAVADELELNTAESYWPFPTYGDLLFSI